MRRTVLVGASILFVLSLSSCGPDNKGETFDIKKTQTVGGYTFTLAGDLEDGTQYRRMVWEITAPDGRTFVAIRGYGVSEITAERRGKTTVHVER